MPKIILNGVDYYKSTISGGDSVEWSQIETSGTKIAEITINGDVTEVYAPSGGGSSGHNYSTQEQVVGTWIDGKPIYQKTYVLPNQISIGSNVNLTSYMSDIAGVVDRFLLAYGYGNTARSVNTFYIQFFNSTISAWSNLSFDVDIITVQYIKTTD